MLAARALRAENRLKAFEGTKGKDSEHVDISDASADASVDGKVSMTCGSTVLKADTDLSVLLDSSVELARFGYRDFQQSIIDGCVPACFPRTNNATSQRTKWRV